jgi:tRNA nucleotidyltransferase/poly(A) polymerase
MPDYMFLLESRLMPEQRATMMRVQELSAALGMNVYLTGGTVRDLITGANLRDLDFTVEGNPAKIARELEKGGAKVTHEDEKTRHIEIQFAGEGEGSISGARDDHYVRPGTRPEIRWSTIMEDLRRRDFSLNAIAISLNPASRGLLLDPTNGLSDIERGEVRALTIHSFTNQPVRLLRALRYAARMGFKLEARTQEWMALAMERDLHHSITPEDAGAELHALAREEQPTEILKAWEQHGLLEVVHPLLAKKKPDYDAIDDLSKVRDDLMMAGLRGRLATPMLLAILGRLKDREQSSLLSKLGFRAAEIDRVSGFAETADAAAKELTGKKLNAPIDAYRFLEKMPADTMAYLLAESRNSTALSKIRAYLHKWRPLRTGVPGLREELVKIGMPEGLKFDAVIDQMFALQLNGRGKTPEEREKVMRKLSGIKEPPKQKEPKGKDKKAAKAIAKAHEAKTAAAEKSKALEAKPSAKLDHKHAGKGAHPPAYKAAKGKKK